MPEWTKDKEKKVLWKYRFLLTFRIIRVIIILFFLYGIYMIILSIGYSKTNLPYKNEFEMNLAIDWTQAGNYGEIGSHLREITPFFSQKVSFPIYRTIGKEEQPIGTVNLIKRVGPFSNKEITYLNPTDAKLFQFYLPEDPRSGKAFKLSNTPEVWNALNKVHEGTVANLAFSTTTFLKPEELLDVLKDYDIDVVWMPLYSGELKKIKVGYTLGGDNYLSVDTLGLSKARETDDYRSFSLNGIRNESIKENEKIMLSNMKMLIDNESSTYLETVLGLKYLNERYHYLKKNGFYVYGAVVTGPVKELLKLKDLDVLQGAQLGKFEYWNWTEKE